MRLALVLAWGLLAVSGSATAQVSIQLGLPSVRIGVQIGGYPDLVAVPGYPVYYAPQLGSNLFFYDGLYWVYAEDQWYASSWYDGPWDLVAPESVPYFVLRVPVRYYRQPPAYFNGWGRDAPPRWGEHWDRTGTGAMAAGTTGIARPLPPRRRCRPTSALTPAIAIRTPASNARCATATTTTSRTRPS